MKYKAVIAVKKFPFSIIFYMMSNSQPNSVGGILAAYVEVKY